jgi:hypothetical protein
VAENQTSMSLFNWKKKKTEEAPQPLYNRDEMLFARLLFETKPEIDDGAVQQELNTQFAKVESTGKENANARQYFFPEYQAQFKEGSLPAQCTIFRPELSDIARTLEKAYQQIWHWPEAKEETASCKYELVLSDLLSRTLDYKQRNEMFQKFVMAVAKALKPKAIYFPTSEKVMEPAQYFFIMESEGIECLYGLLNVRLFNLPDASMLMDTVGLHAFGLPDFQFQFKDYDPGVIAGLLSSFGHYIFANGSVILNENTVEGVEEGSRWKCVYDRATLPPDRNVLTIHE